MSKIPSRKQTAGVAQVVEHLPSKREALNSPVPQRRKKKKERKKIISR
jgi:hypothetical protein